MYSREDLLTLCMAREVRDGELVPLGLGTPLVAVAASVAKKLHAPGLWLLHPGNALSSKAFLPLDIGRAEARALKGAAQHVPVDVMVWMTIAKSSVRQFLRPAQIDPAGGVNTVAVVRAGRPAARLPGAAIIPEAGLGAFSRFSLYMPRHDRRAFVTRVDYRTACVAGPVHAGLPVRVFTDLCVLEYAEPVGLRLVSVHPGVSVDDVREASGCPIAAASEVPTTPPPTFAELEALEAVDPRRSRRLEFLPAGPDRRLMLQELLS